MTTKSMAKGALLLSVLALSSAACGDVSEAELGSDSQALTPSALSYNPTTQKFSRTVVREIQVTNPKQFPFRVDENSSFVVALEWLPEADPSRNWDSSRPSTYTVYFSNDGSTWAPAPVPAGCVTTASEAAPLPAPCTFVAASDTTHALVDMSTTPGNLGPNDVRARFALQYTFTGPSDVHQSERPTSTTLNVTNLSVNDTQKAVLDAAQTLPGALEGQGLTLVLERSHPNVIEEPNGPKLKDRATGREQFDGLDFLCGAWVNIPNTTPQRARKTCEIEGAVTRDSLIHAPFLIKPDTAASGRWAKVTITRQYLNGYVRQ